MTWKGVVIEESLENREIFNIVNIVSRREAFLENEEEKGKMVLYSFELDDSKKEKFLDVCKNSIKQGWYLHICKDKTMAVIFRGIIFEFTKLQKEKMKEAVEYGISIGILKDQMDFEHMIENPFD